MSNNKQSMELYTEEEVREAIKMARSSYNIFPTSVTFMYAQYEILGNLTPIELPSDSLCVNCDETESTHNICMDCIIKIGKENIELPSDEEIESKSSNEYQEQKQSYENSVEMFPIDFGNYLEVGFIEGAKWMRNKIQGGEQ